MFVCFRYLSMYCCMLQVAERVCLYVSGGGACMFVCMSQVAKRVCLYVSGR